MNVRRVILLLNQLLACILLFSYLSLSCLAQASNEPRVSFTKTNSGFYYPTGITENQFRETGGKWLGRDAEHGGALNGHTPYNSPRYHIGQDILAAIGDPVFAIAEGVVNNVSLNGWGDGNVGLLIRHTLSDGTGFFALYGHIRTPLKVGDIVTGGVEFGQIGPWPDGNHLHFGIHPELVVPFSNPLTDANAKNWGYMGNNFWPDGGQPDTNGFVNPIDYIKAHSPVCQNGSSEQYLPGGQIPFHPDGSIVKLKSGNTAYVLRDNKKIGIPDRNTLNTLYGFGRGFDFQDIITISQQEFDQYPDGGVITSPLPNNNRNAPDGRLIRQWGSVETSIVTQYNHQDGFRMPFATGSAFLNLGYAECNIAGVSDYTSGYPIPPSGISVENMRGFHTTGGVDPNFAISVSASPNSPSPGQSTTVTVTVTNNGGTANDRIVDVEIFDSTGSRVLQQFFDHQFLTAGMSVPYNVNWTAGAAGTYTVKVGIFTSGWVSQDIWNNNALSVTVGSSTLPPGPYQLDIWWPTDGAQISGTQQPFKTLVENIALSNYVMYWQVDSGGLNLMQDSSVGGSHKEYIVDVTGWTWNGTGPYTVNFIAKDVSGNVLVQRAVRVTVIH